MKIQNLFLNCTKTVRCRVSRTPIRLGRTDLISQYEGRTGKEQLEKILQEA